MKGCKPEVPKRPPGDDKGVVGLYGRGSGIPGDVAVSFTVRSSWLDRDLVRSSCRCGRYDKLVVDIWSEAWKPRTRRNSRDWQGKHARRPGIGPFVKCKLSRRIVRRRRSD